MNSKAIYFLIIIISAINCLGSQQETPSIEYGRLDDHGYVLVTFPQSMTQMPQNMRVEYRWAKKSNCGLPDRFVNREQLIQATVTGGEFDVETQRNCYVATITLQARDKSCFDTLKSRVPDLIKEALLANRVREVNPAR